MGYEGGSGSGNAADGNTNSDDGTPDQCVPNTREASTYTDPRNAVYPTNLAGCHVDHLIADRLSLGDVPTGLDRDTPLILAPPFTTPSNVYITQACAVCTLLSLGYAVFRTAPPYTELHENTSKYTTLPPPTGAVPRRILDHRHEGAWTALTALLGA